MHMDDPFILPTLENRLTAHLLSHGIDMAPGEYIVRQARYVRGWPDWGSTAKPWLLRRRFWINSLTCCWAMGVVQYRL